MKIVTFLPFVFFLRYTHKYHTPEGSEREQDKGKTVARQGGGKTTTRQEKAQRLPLLCFQNTENTSPLFFSPSDRCECEGFRVRVRLGLGLGLGF